MTTDMIITDMVVTDTEVMITKDTVVMDMMVTKITDTVVTVMDMTTDMIITDMVVMITKDTVVTDTEVMITKDTVVTVMDMTVMIITVTEMIITITTDTDTEVINVLLISRKRTLILQFLEKDGVWFYHYFSSNERASAVCGEILRQRDSKWQSEIEKERCVQDMLAGKCKCITIKKIARLATTTQRLSGFSPLMKGIIFDLQRQLGQNHDHDHLRHLHDFGIRLVAHQHQREPCVAVGWAAQPDLF